MTELGTQNPEPIANEPRERGLIRLLDFMILLLRHRRRILLSAVIGFVIGIAAIFILPVSYTATTTILPPQQSSSSSILSQFGGLASLGSLSGAASGLSLKIPLDMYVSLLKSISVEDAMVQRFHLKDEYHVKRDSDARRLLERHALIDGTGKDGFIRISLSDSSPTRARDLANGYVEEYRRFSEKLAITEAAQRRLFFESQLENEKNNLASAEEELKRTEQSSGAIQPESQVRVMIEAAANLRAQITAKEVQLQAMRTYAGAGNVDLLSGEQELSALRDQLTKLTGNNSDSEASMMVSKSSIPQASLEYVRNLREVKYHETLFEILARQFEAAKLDEAKEGAPIQIVDRAQVPDKRSSLRPPFILLAFVIGGALIAIAWILMNHVLEALCADTTVNSRIQQIKQLRGRSS